MTTTHSTMAKIALWSLATICGILLAGLTMGATVEMLDASQIPARGVTDQ